MLGLKDHQFHITCVGSTPWPYEEYMNLYAFELMALGGEVTIAHHQLRDDAINLVFGAFYLQAPYLHHHQSLEWYTEFIQTYLKIPEKIIFCNLEQIYPGSPIFGLSHINMAKRSYVFDYSLKNIKALARAGIQNVSYVPPLYSKSLEYAKPADNPETIILFAGSHTPYREQTIRAIEAEIGQSVSYVQWSWGEELRQKILQSKIILNLKGHPENDIFEVLRCVFPVANERLVISEMTESTEIHPALIKSVVLSEPQHLPSLCKMFVEDEIKRKETALQNFNHFKKSSFSGAVLKGMTEFFSAAAVDKTVLSPYLPAPKKIKIGNLPDEIWDYEWLHINAEAASGVDIVWQPDSDFPFDTLINTLRFGTLRLHKQSISQINVKLYPARLKHFSTFMYAMLELLEEQGTLNITLPYGNEAWDLPYAIRSFNENSLGAFVGDEARKQGWHDFSFTQTAVNYQPSVFGAQLAQDKGLDDFMGWVRTPGAVKNIMTTLVKTRLANKIHPFDLDGFMSL